MIRKETHGSVDQAEMSSTNHQRSASMFDGTHCSATLKASTSTVPGQHHHQTVVAKVKERDFVERDGYESDNDSCGHDSAIDLRNEDESNDPFKLVEIPGKGVGMIATRDIRRGERILVEEPLIRHAPYFDTSEIIKAYLELTDIEKSQVARLHNAHPEKQHPVLGIIRTNSISLSRQDSGLFIIASRINHACAPNASHSWNVNLEAMSVHATIDIRKGEEITNSYFEGVGSQADRQFFLLKCFGFRCDCSRCRLSGVEMEQSDYRARRIKILEGKLECALPFKPPERTPCPDIRLYGNIRELLSHYEHEEIKDGRLPKAYTYGWRLSCRNGLGRRVVEFSERIHTLYSIIKGCDHPDTEFWRNRLAGARRQLLSLPSAEEMPPQGEEERESWLFMNQSKKSSDWGEDMIVPDQEISEREWWVTRRSQ